jgi:hypothetical protein
MNHMTLDIIALVLALYATVLSSFTALRPPSASSFTALRPPSANRKVLGVLSVSHMLTNDVAEKMCKHLEEEIARGGSIILGPGMTFELHEVN